MIRAWQMEGFVHVMHFAMRFAMLSAMLSAPVPIDFRKPT